MSKWSDFLSKAKPKLPFSSSASTTQHQNPYIQSSIELDRQNKQSRQQPQAMGMMDKAKNFVLGRKEEEPQGCLSVFNCLPGEKNYTLAVICAGVACFFIFMCVILAPEIMIVPAKWSMCFTISMISLIMALAFLAGPRLYVKKLFLAKNLWASILLLSSMAGGFWTSVITQSWLWSLLFCVLELMAVIFYFFNTAVISMGTIKWVCKQLGSMIAGMFRNI